MQLFDETLLRALTLIRRTVKTPLHWHRSMGIGLAKNDKPGMKGRRVIHSLPAVGKGYFAYKLKAQLASQDHGFAPHRRREGALLATQ
eukprot:7152830-Pyramimonas_sp.AAC.1